VRITLEVAGRRHEIDLARTDARVDLEVDGQPLQAKVRPLGGTRYEVTIGTRRLDVDVVASDRAIISGRPTPFQVAAFLPVGVDGAASASDGRIRPPMPGAIAKVLVAEGDSVEKGRPILVLEAMKMQNEITAPFSGVISKIPVKVGDAVKLTDVVIEMAPKEDSNGRKA
jgi:biotin carboxyl carrier protein